ncbi:PQQ-binding-like beta-propeller repeat protein [Candidatus Hydrogenedentota bacterium]
MRSSIFVVSLLTVITLAAFAGPSASANWPQFQGPDRNGVSNETGLLRSWPEEGPKTLWKMPLGIGFGSPAIVDGKVYVLDRTGQKKGNKQGGRGHGQGGRNRPAEDKPKGEKPRGERSKVSNEKDVFRCLDLETGKELWKLEFANPGGINKFDGSRGTPTVSGDRAYCVGLMGDLYCIDINKRKIVWQKNIPKEFGADMLGWGVAQSPEIHGDMLLVSPQGKGVDVSVVALKCSNGEKIWEAESFGNPHYALPSIMTLDGVEQVIQFGAYDRDSKKPGEIAGYSLEDGKALWSFESKWQCSTPIPHALPLSDDRVFITGGYKAGSVMLQVKREGLLFKDFVVKELFTTMDCSSQIHQPLLYKDHIYANSNSNEARDGMICMTLDGELKWRTGKGKGLPNFERGALILVDDMILNLDGNTGKLHLIDPSPEGYKELAQAQLLGGIQIWAPMAISDGKLLLRSQEEMKCLDLRK